jgi:hypothetical protein
MSTTIEHEGEEIALDELQFISLRGRNHTVYMPEEPTKTVIDGQVVTQYEPPGGTSTVQFNNGMYPGPGQEIESKELAKALLKHTFYGKSFKRAASPMELESAAGAETTEEVPEGYVELNGEIIPKEEALQRLAGEETPESEGEPTTIEDVGNKQEALMALAEHGVDMEDAPDASAETDAIQEFALAHGFSIAKYE